MDANVRELILSPHDPCDGIDHRWELRDAEPEPHGTLLGYVVHVRASTGSWPGPPYYLCSRCREGEQDPRQFDHDASGFCWHVARVHAHEQGGAAT